MRILDQKINRKDLLKAEVVFDGPMVKGAVDIRRKLVGIDAEMHADVERLFLENGSAQDDLWGVNFYPEEEGEDFVEFDSMINIRPRQNNRSRYVEDAKTREQILEVIDQWFN